MGCSNGSGVVSCPNPAAPDAQQSFFRAFRASDPRQRYLERHLLDRIDMLNPLVHQPHGLADRVRASSLAHGGTPPTQRREGHSTTSDTTRNCGCLPNHNDRLRDLRRVTQPGYHVKAAGETQANGGPTPSPCSYCARTMDPLSGDAGELATRIPCGHGGMVHAQCVRIRAIHRAHRYPDWDTCF